MSLDLNNTDIETAIGKYIEDSTKESDDFIKKMNEKDKLEKQYKKDCIDEKRVLQMFLRAQKRKIETKAKLQELLANLQSNKNITSNSNTKNNSKKD